MSRKHGVYFYSHNDPECQFTERECFARQSGICTILTEMPKPRRGHKCPFCKKCKDTVVK